MGLVYTLINMGGQYALITMAIKSSLARAIGEPTRHICFRMECLTTIAFKWTVCSKTKESGSHDNRNLKTLGLIGEDLQDIPRHGLHHNRWRLHSRRHRKHTAVPAAWVIAVHPLVLQTYKRPSLLHRLHYQPFHSIKFLNYMIPIAFTIWQNMPKFRQIA